jgi:hypothetical protein
MGGLHTAKQYAEKRVTKQSAVKPVQKSAPEVRQPLHLWSLMHPEQPMQGSALTVTMNVEIDGEPFILSVKDGAVRTYHDKLANWLIAHGYIFLSKELI